MPASKWLPVIAVIGIILIALGVYSIYKPTPVVQPKPEPAVTQAESPITINGDGSWTVKLDSKIGWGVPLQTDKQTFTVSSGDNLEISATGLIDIGMGSIGPNGQLNYKDPYVDSKFNDHVGGLEMWIGPEKSKNRYFIGTNFSGQVKDSGIPTFRVIDTLDGYGNNKGFYLVTVRKK